VRVAVSAISTQFKIAIKSIFSNRIFSLPKNICVYIDDEKLAAFASPNQREQVRNYIEQLLARMLDGPLDDVPVVKLSNNENCEYVYYLALYLLCNQI
jgi:hypothetical protein